MFSQVCVKNSVQGGHMWQWGRGGMYGEGGMHGKEGMHAGGVHSRKYAWWEGGSMRGRVGHTCRSNSH